MGDSPRNFGLEKNWASPVFQVSHQASSNGVFMRIISQTPHLDSSFVVLCSMELEPVSLHGLEKQRSSPGSKSQEWMAKLIRRLNPLKHPPDLLFLSRLPRRPRYPKHVVGENRRLRRCRTQNRGVSPRRSPAQRCVDLKAFQYLNVQSSKRCQKPRQKPPFL